MKKTREQVEAFKLVGQINHGINRYINAKLHRVTQYDSSEGELSDTEESKMLIEKSLGNPTKRKRLAKDVVDLEKIDDDANLPSQKSMYPPT